MPLISVIEECYNELTAIKNKLKSEKKAKGEPTKTTYSEVVCMILREYQRVSQ